MGARFSTLMVTVLAVFNGAAQAADLTVGKYVKVYRGDEGVRVAVAVLEPRSDNKALIQVSGVATAIDGIVLLHEVDENRSRVAFGTTIGGRGHTTLIVNKENWGGTTFSLRLPENVRQSLIVAYDEEASREFKAQELLAIHKKQQQDGSLAQLQDFDRAVHEGEAEADLKSVIEDVAAACGVTPEVSVDWATVTDTQIKQLSIGSYCGKPLTAMRQACEDSEALRAAVPVRIKVVQCSMGERLRLRLSEAGALTWTTNEDAANQVEFAKNYLLNEL